MGVDFAVSVFPTPETFAGDSVRFKVKIVNQGNEDFSDSDNPLEVQFLAGDPGGSLSQIGNLKTVEELQAGRSTVVVSDPWTASEGSKLIRVALDPEGKIAEDSEANNARDNTLLVGLASSRPDLDVEEGVSDVPEAPVMLLTVQNPSSDLLAQFGGQTPKFVYHNWENLSDTVSIEMSDRPTRDGGTTGEDLRDFPEVFRFGIDVKEISPPIRDQDAIHQDFPLQAQVNFARQLKGETVEVTTTKHNVSMVGKVQEVTLSDSGDIDGTSTVQITVREDTSAGEGDGFDLGSLVTLSSSEDPGGDDNQPDRVQRLADALGADYPKVTKAGGELCVRRPTAVSQVVDVLDYVSLLDEEIQLGVAVAKEIKSASETIRTPDVGDLVGGTVDATVNSFSKTAHALGVSGSDVAKGLSPTPNTSRWINLGPVSGGLDFTPRRETAKDRLRQRALRIIRTNQNEFVDGTDYRFTDDPVRDLEVSAAFYARVLQAKGKIVRCQ